MSAADRELEVPVLYRAGDDDLFGILTRATTPWNGTTVLLLAGGRYMPSTHRNRLWVRAARSLADRGYHVLRIDYHGVGESTGEVKEWRIDLPFVDDVDGAVRWLETQGLSRVVMVGSCFGGRTALAAAERVPDLKGVALFAPAVRDFELGQRNVETTGVVVDLRRLRSRHVSRDLLDPMLRRRYLRRLRMRGRALLDSARGRSVAGDDAGFLTRVSRNFLDPLEGLVDRKVPVLFAYGHDDEDYDEFTRATKGRLGKILRRADGLIRVETVPGQVHGFTTLVVQGQAIEIVSDWLDSVLQAGADTSLPVPEMH